MKEYIANISYEYVGNITDNGIEPGDDGYAQISFGTEPQRNVLLEMMLGNLSSLAIEASGVNATLEIGEISNEEKRPWYIINVNDKKVSEEVLFHTYLKSNSDMDAVKRVVYAKDEPFSNDRSLVITSVKNGGFLGFRWMLGNFPQILSLEEIKNTFQINVLSSLSVYMLFKTDGTIKRVLAGPQQSAFNMLQYRDNFLKDEDV